MMERIRSDMKGRDFIVTDLNTHSNKGTSWASFRSKHHCNNCEYLIPENEQILLKREKKTGLPGKGSPFVVEFTGRESMCGDTVWTPINLPVKSALAIGV
jgi:hypothetical protein